MAMGWRGWRGCLEIWIAPYCARAVKHPRGSHRWGRDLARSTAAECVNERLRQSPRKHAFPGEVYASICDCDTWGGAVRRVHSTGAGAEHENFPGAWRPAANTRIEHRE